MKPVHPGPTGKGGLQEIAVAHIGIVVRDVVQSIEEFDRVLGPSSWEVFDVTPEVFEGVEWEGRRVDFSIRAALGSLGGIVIELIEPLDDADNPFAEHLEAHGPGMHHLMLLGGDARGPNPSVHFDLPPLMTGMFEGTLAAAYLDGRTSLGFIIETTSGTADRARVVNRRMIDRREQRLQPEN